MTPFLIALLSVFIVSLIAFVGIFTFSLNTSRLQKILIYLISFSAGALFGDAFIHLLPELVEEAGFTLLTSVSILGGIVIFFILEKIIHWQHCHMPVTQEHVHPFAYTNLIGDGLHNFIDGIIIGASYIVSIPVGIATTIAVALHEIPQEIGDFGVLLHAGFSRTKALMLNFISALMAIFGVLVTFWLAGNIENLISILIPIAAGGFIYIAGSDLIPELHRHSRSIKHSILQLLSFIFGMGVMALLLLLE